MLYPFVCNLGHNECKQVLRTVSRRNSKSMEFWEANNPIFGLMRRIECLPTSKHRLILFTRRSQKAASKLADKNIVSAGSCSVLYIIQFLIKCGMRILKRCGPGGDTEFSSLAVLLGDHCPCYRAETGRAFCGSRSEFLGLGWCRRSPRTRRRCCKSYISMSGRPSSGAEGNFFLHLVMNPSSDLPVTQTTYPIISLDHPLSNRDSFSAFQAFRNLERGKIAPPKAR